MRIATIIYLVLLGAMTLLLGVGYLMKPVDMTAPMGFGTLAPAALTDLRATYGGLQIGLGLFLFYCIKPARAKFGLLLAVFFLSCVMLSRLYGLMVDGDITPTLKSATIMELVMAAVALILWFRTPAPASAT